MAPKIEIPSLSIRELLNLQRSFSNTRRITDLDSVMDIESFRPLIVQLCKYGKPYHDEVKMFRVTILQSALGLNDEEMEAELCDRLSYQKFIGISSFHDIPTVSDIRQFRACLGDEGYNRLVYEFYENLKAKGLSIKRHMS